MFETKKTAISSIETDPIDFNEPSWDQITLKFIDEIEAEYSKKQTQIQSKVGFNYYHSMYQRFHSIHPNLQNLHSLYSRFRLARKFLSVSDLVSCVWCQVQVEYGLLGKRYLKPSLRPKSFITSSGVEIKVNSNLVASRQKILDSGTRVHTKLEKEVAPEAVRVEVVTQADTWGLKVMNTIVNLSLLRSTGMMREIHIWGFIGGFLIQGIIDQIDLIPVPSTSKLTDQSSPNNNNHNDFFASPSGNDTTFPSSDTPPLARNSTKRFLARISDSKTTQNTTLPPPEHTDSARYQLMLYKYLHDQNASGRFDIDKFGAHLGIDLDESFSPLFLRDIKPTLMTIGESLKDYEEVMFSSPKTLRSMFKLYRRLIKIIGVSDETLEIVYRKRGRRQNRSTNVKNSKKLKLKHDSSDVQKCLDETTTIAILTHPSSLLNSATNPIEIPSDSQPIDPKVQLDKLKQEITKPKSIQDAQKLINGSDEPSQCPDEISIPSGTKEERALNDLKKKEFRSYIDQDTTSRIVQDFSKFSSVEKMRARLDKQDDDSKNKGIVGSFEFEFHPIEFSQFIIDAVRFWNGDQDPVGVDVKESNKCESCEFKDGCEWRSKISKQIIDSI